MERQYDGYKDRRGNERIYIEYDVQVEETIKCLGAAHDQEWMVWT